MSKKIIFLFLIAISIYGQLPKVEYMGGKLLVLNSDGFFKEVQDNRFEKIIIDNDTSAINNFIIVDSLTCYAFKANTLYITKNSGASWTLVKKMNFEIKSVCVSNNCIYLQSTDNYLYSSTNYGIDWDSIQINLPITDLIDCSLKAVQPPNTVYLYGSKYLPVTGLTAYVFTSSFPYSTWTHVEEISQELGNIKFLSQSAGFVVSRFRFYRTTNGGTNWTYSNPERAWGGEAAFVNSSTSYASLYNPISIIKTTDAGNTWDNFATNLGNLVKSIAATDTKVAYTISGEKIVHITTDNGISWNTLDPINLTNVEDEIGSPNNFTLNQNYPNPFNPSTTITFSIPSKQFVTLKVFDILGIEIASLINEELTAGSYNKNWNPSNISSGVYFYQLKAGNFSQTKKMILTK